MTSPISATFALGGDLTINRLGFGAMRLTGEGVWGPPADRDECLRVLRRAVELGVNFIDTADSYGPAVSEELIREALHPYDGVTIATGTSKVTHLEENVAAARIELTGTEFDALSEAGAAQG